MNNKKKLLSMALSAALILGTGVPMSNIEITNSAFLVASAAESDEIAYDIYSDHIVIARCNAITEKVTIPSEYNGLPVTEIGENAFLGNTSINSVEIPDSVKYIGESAFSMCKNLQSVNIPASVKEIGGLAFNNTKWLLEQRSNSPLVIVNNIVVDGSACGTSVTIPDGTVAISDYAFADCDKLETVVIPKSVTSIGATSFRGTLWERKTKTSYDSLEINNILVSGGKKPASDDEAADDVVIMSEKLSNYAYADHNDYTVIQLSGDVKVIGNSAFCGFQSLEKFEVYAPVKEIKSHAFEDCRSLKTFSFVNDNISEIGSYAFNNCTSLSEITLPNTIATVGKGAFDHCSGMKKITISNPDCFIFDSNETIGKESVIYGYAGSSAEAYAQKYNRSFVALESAPVTTTDASSVVTTTAVTTIAASTTTVTTTADTVTTEPVTTTENKGNKVVITLPNVPEGAKILVAVVKGDTDGNSKVDSSDASMILQEYARLSTGGEASFGDDQKAVIDINGDGTVNAKDASAVLEFYSFVSTGGEATLCEHFGVDSRIRGDVNGDGFVELTDLATLRQYISHASEIEIDKYNADVNGDGFVDVTDLSTLSLKLIECRKDGDANGDGEVDENDKTVYETYIYGSGEKHIVEKTADLDKDGKVNLTDYILFCELTLTKDIKGDVNEDGDVNLADLATLKQIVGKQDVQYNEKNADINGDGKVDMTDLSTMSLKLVDN